MSAAQNKVTPFQKRVYDATRRIPRGKVSTYGLIARAIGSASPRAVGQALRRNPFAPAVPCHRVIAGDLTIGGFGGAAAGAKIRRKTAMLAREGVRFDSGSLADTARLFTFARRRKP